MNKNINGFTVVELLVVIVVIGILAGITIISYSQIRINALSSQRASDMEKITKALEMYRVKNGAYPPVTPSTECPGATGGWETSHTCPDSFMTALRPYLGTKTMVDPKNSAANHYAYFRYAAGANGCDTARGAYYVLKIVGPAKDPLISTSLGWKCPSRDWSAEGRWVGGSFVN